MVTRKGVPNGSTILSKRELQVIRLHVDGKSSGAIGRELGISVKTASTHKARASFKLGFGNYMPTDVALAYRAADYLKQLTAPPAAPPAGDLTPVSSSEAPAVSIPESV